MFGRTNGFDRKAALGKMAKLQTEGDANNIKAQAELAAARQAELEWEAPRRRREAAQLAVQQAADGVNYQIGSLECELRTNAAPFIDRARSLVYERLQNARGGVDHENSAEKGPLIDALTAALIALEQAAVSADVPAAIQAILATIPQDDWRKFEPEYPRAQKNLEAISEPLMIGLE